jgi:UrcA family protein
METFRRTALGCVVVCVACVVSLRADAGKPGEMVVTYRDLDLNTHAGVAAMYGRLEVAARTVCTAHERPSSRDGTRACVDTSVRQAVAEIGAPQLIMLYETRTGHAVLRARR